VHARAEAAAERLLAAGGEDDNERLRRAYLAFLGRPPSAEEQQAVAAFLVNYPRTVTGQGGKAAPGDAQKATWTALCQALFASADFLNRN
jgi:hypothetical protein